MVRFTRWCWAMLKWWGLGRRSIATGAKCRTWCQQTRIFSLTPISASIYRQKCSKATASQRLYNPILRWRCGRIGKRKPSFELVARKFSSHAMKLILAALASAAARLSKFDKGSNASVSRFFALAQCVRECRCAAAPPFLNRSTMPLPADASHRFVGACAIPAR